jgi:hypothetical protein
MSAPSIACYRTVCPLSFPHETKRPTATRCFCCELDFQAIIYLEETAGSLQRIIINVKFHILYAIAQS